jgi:integrase/recombinase XerD
MVVDVNSKSFVRYSNERYFSQLKKLETELTLRGMSKSTKKAYFKFNAQFLRFIQKSPDNITKDDIKNYLAELIGKETAPRTINLARSALLFYYNEVLEQGIVGVKVPKIKRSLPIYLSKEEVANLIDKGGSNKSKIIIKFLYSSGLRVSEVCNLKIEDLELKDRKGFVRGGKGGKDRLFFVSQTLAYELEDFIGNRKKGYVFENYQGERSSERNVQKIVSLAGKRAMINKPVTPHKLRHSFATHLHDAGTSIRTIQELLGHSNLQTTEIYTHVSEKGLGKVKNPLDGI